MPLAEIWIQTPEVLAGKHIHQVIGFAGDGHLREGNACSLEYQAFLRVVPSRVLATYARECLTTRFDEGGAALQDIVNEVGRRLGFAVTNGRYRGATQHIGFDGLWRVEDGSAIVIETKTTDTYRLDLGVLAGYRQALAKNGVIEEDRSSALIVVGREGTGELEAQIRGSRYAWDIRLISIEALLRLLSIRETLEEPAALIKIQEVLKPMEFTRVDGIIDLVFSAAEDVQERVEEEAGGEEQTKENLEGSQLPAVRFNEACIERIQAQLGQPLVQRTRAKFSTVDDSTAVVCAVSREYGKEAATDYWFGFHPHQKEWLEKAAVAYVAFGCGSPDSTLLIPAKDFFVWLPGMNVTNRGEGRMYWHVSIYLEGDKFVLRRRAGQERLDLSAYLVA
jgi:hypothetical protein